jgi:hypothetical protein
MVDFNAAHHRIASARRPKNFNRSLELSFFACGACGGNLGSGATCTWRCKFDYAPSMKRPMLKRRYVLIEEKEHKE